MKAPEKAKEMTSVILKTLQKEGDPAAPIIELYIENELEKHRKTTAPWSA